MAITRAAGFPVFGTSSATSVSATWVTVGDLAVVCAANFTNSTGHITAISSSKVTWNGTVAIAAADGVNGWHLDIWIGTVSSTGSDTITLTWSATPSGPEIAVDEFTAGLGATTWTVVGTNSAQQGSGTDNYATITSGSAALQMYWGYMVFAAAYQAGSTTGFTYTQTTDSNGVVFNGTLATSTAYAPTIGSYGADVFSATAIVSAASAAAASTPINPAFLILEQYGFLQALQSPPATSSAVNANPTAGLSSVTVSAFPALPSVTGFDQTGAPVTVTGLDANNPQVGAQPSTPNVTVSGLDATVNIQGNGNANAGNANVNVAGVNALPTVTAVPQTANVTVGANNPTIIGGVPVLGAPFPIEYLLAIFGTAIFPTPLSQTGTNDTALPQFTAVTVAAFNAAPSTVTAQPGVAAVTVASPTVTQQVLVPVPTTPNVTVAALGPLPLVNALPTVAPVNIVAFNPSVTTGGSITVFPGVANVTVAALNPSVRLDAAPTAGLAAVTVAANNPVAGVSPAAAVALAVLVAGFGALPTVSGTPPAASVMAAAVILAVSGTGSHVGHLKTKSAATTAITAKTSAATEHLTIET